MPLESRFCTTCGRPLPAIWHPASAARLPRRPIRERPGLLAAIILGLAGAAGLAGAIAIGLNVDRSARDDLASSSPRPSAAVGDVRSVSCATPDLDCERLTVAADPADPEAGVLDIVFGVHPAEDEREGTLVIATGGPGTSGIGAAGYYLATIPPDVLDRYDVVFFDQRGVGRSSPLECPDSERSYVEPPTVRDPNAGDEAASGRWVQQCLSEAEVGGDDLSAFATVRVADDIDAIRRHLGTDGLFLYGESYGTIVLQQYAASYPARVDGLILDGPVDTTLDGPTFASEQLEAFESVTRATLAACAADAECLADFNGADPAATWDALVARLEQRGTVVDYPLLDGGSAARPVTIEDLLGIGLSMSYTEYDRVTLLRALAAASRDDLVPLLELAYRNAFVDPETLEPMAKGTEGLALFLAVHCSNYADGGSRDAMLHELIERREQLATDGNAYARTIWDDLPCLTGFAPAGAVERPGAPEGDFPTIILTATADPATPTQWADRVAAQASDAYLVRTEGGSHVTYGLGLPCPDDLVNDFLVSGDLPDDRISQCPGSVLAPYVSTLRESIAAYEDVADALVAIEANVSGSPAFLAWDGLPLTTACRHGGFMTLSWQADQEVELKQCELIAGWALSGKVRFQANGTTAMDLSAPNADLDYESSASWWVTVTGTLDGDAVDIARQFTP
jgi:pimeloyl-ACP methyl ester carboxylesterase